MGWFALARVIFAAIVTYTAAILHPLSLGLAANIVFALVLTGLVVFCESRLRQTAVTRLLGALLGGAVGLLIARAIAAGILWADATDSRIAFLDSFILIALP